MKPKIDEARERVLALQTEIRTFADKAKASEVDEKAEKLSDDEETRFEAALGEFEAARTELAPLEERARKVAAAVSLKTDSATGADPVTAPNQINRNDPLKMDLQSSSRSERRDAALQWVEDRGKSKQLDERQQGHVEKLLKGGHTANFDGDYIARRALATDSEDYKNGWFKWVNKKELSLTSDERKAMEVYAQNESRAASEGAGSAGGYGVPIVIDPSIVLTAGALDAPILGISKMVTITTDQWKGVTSAGLTFEYTAEAAVVADKTPTLAQPTIPVYRADGFIPYSFEIGQDYPGFAEEMGALLDQGYVNLVAAQTMTGSGSSAPTGIFTALQAAGGKCADGTSGTAVTASSLGHLLSADIRATWAAEPELFRQRSTWVMNISVENQIRALGNNLALADFTTDMTADGLSVLNGRPIVRSDYAPQYNSTTATTQQFCVLGDFSKFLIVQRAGMVVEQIEHLFSTTNGYPTGQRGWLAWTRNGYNALSGNPFRILSNGS